MSEELLASDRDREAAVLRLRADHLDGRLSLEELEGRLSRAHAARTLGELDRLQADLPRRRPQTQPSGPSRRPWLPGRRSFNQRIVLSVEPDIALEQALATIVPAMDNVGWRLQRETHEQLIFTNGPDRLTVRLRPHDAHKTLLLVYGRAGLAVRRAFFDLSG